VKSILFRTACKSNTARQWFSNFFRCDAYEKVCWACDAPGIRC